MDDEHRSVYVKGVMVQFKEAGFEIPTDLMHMFAEPFQTVQDYHQLRSNY